MAIRQQWEAWITLTILKSVPPISAISYMRIQVQMSEQSFGDNVSAENIRAAIIKMQSKAKQSQVQFETTLPKATETHE